MAGTSNEQASRGRRWCYTIQISEQEYKETDWSKFVNDNTVQYSKWSVERAPTTGQLHIQGYIHFKNERAFKTVKKFLGGTAHIEKQKGSDASNEDYTGKDYTHVDGPWTFGERSAGQGARSDLKEAAEKIKNGGSLKDIPADLLVKYGRGFRELQNLAISEPQRRNKVTTIVIWGETGVGKTWNVMMNQPPGGVYKMEFSNSGAVWFDGYRGEKTLLIDEYDEQLKVQKLNQYLDPYSMKLDIKGSAGFACWDTVIITSNRDPSHWYISCDAKIKAAVDRRTLANSFEVKTKEEMSTLWKKILETQYNVKEEEEVPAAPATPVMQNPPTPIPSPKLKRRNAEIIEIKD